MAEAKTFEQALRDRADAAEAVCEEFFRLLNEIVAEWGKYHDDDGITRIPTDELREQVIRLRELDDSRGVPTRGSDRLRKNP